MSKVTVLDDPAVRETFWKPRSCFGGEAGALDGRPMYSWATSAPVTVPLFVTLAVTVATVSNRPVAPPGPGAVLPAVLSVYEVVRPE